MGPAGHSNWPNATASASRPPPSGIVDPCRQVGGSFRSTGVCTTCPTGVSTGSAAAAVIALPSEMVKESISEERLLNLPEETRVSVWPGASSAGQASSPQRDAGRQGCIHRLGDGGRAARRKPGPA